MHRWHLNCAKLFSDHGITSIGMAIGNKDENGGCEKKIEKQRRVGAHDYGACMQDFIKALLNCWHSNEAFLHHMCVLVFDVVMQHIIFLVCDYYYG